MEPDRRAAVFSEIHRDLPREGPGDRASTRRAFGLVGELTATARVLDVGCGPGAQTIDLATMTPASIIALDVHPTYLSELRSRVGNAGTSAVRLVRASMDRLPFTPASFDLIWSEGAIYILGFERGLREWRALLRDGGRLAVSHLSWLSSDIPNEPRKFWDHHYPAMRSVETNLEISRQCGYEVIAHFPIPESAWWDDYYGPLEARLAALRERYQDDREALSVIASSQEQIDLYRRYSTVYGYVFYVLRRSEF